MGIGFGPGGEHAVKHFLMVFDRLQGRVIENTECPDHSSALGARFRAERRYADSPDVEVVVLGAASMAALHKTHARYFHSAGELAREAAASIKVRG